MNKLTSRTPLCIANVEVFQVINQVFLLATFNIFFPADNVHILSFFNFNQLQVLVEVFFSMVLLLLKVRFVLRVWSLGYEHQYGTVQACCEVRRYQINIYRKDLINDLPHEICKSEIVTAEKHGKIVTVTDDKRIYSRKWN